MTTALAAIDTASLSRRIVLDWTEDDLLALERELSPYINAIRSHFALGRPVQSHLPRTASLCSPITEITDPCELYRDAAGSVSGEAFDAEEYEDYWVLTHQSAVPVAILLLKRYPGPLPQHEALCRRCTAALGKTVGGTSYFQWNLPGFTWAMHTDDEYEGVWERVHVPLYTNPENLFVWAATLDATPDQWLLAQHLERGKIYVARTDVPHTTVNGHPTESRLHLILDVAAC
jgi:hypothetical protein